MHLTRISVRDVRSMRGLEWSVPKEKGAGWHVFVGANGAGKSTLLGAVALVGPRAAMQRRRRRPTAVSGYRRQDPDTA